MRHTETQRVAVVLAVHKPPMDLLRIQLESIRAQSGVEVRLYAVLDGAETCSDAAIMLLLEEYNGHVIREQTGLGVRGAFARGLEVALADNNAEDCLYAFADQDDRWNPGKLHKTAAALLASGAGLASCDAHVVDESFSLISSSLERLENRQRGQFLLDNLLINTVTGMTAVFTREVAERVVCLSRNLKASALHDHIAAMAAASSGGLAYVDEPLVDYVNHDTNNLGAVRWQSRPWWTRTFSAVAMAEYHATSVAMFQERRNLAVKLAECGIPLGPVETLFLVSRRPNPIVLYASYWIAAWRLMRSGQSRNLRLCIRLLPVAMRFWFKGLPPRQQM